MEILPATWPALCALAFMLGLRHGFDADHLAAIDGMTRLNAPENPRLARAVGAWFSLGHGAVVVVVAIGAGALAASWATPRWLEFTGVAISVGVLFALAILNVRAVVRSAPHAVVAPVGLKCRWLAPLMQARRPWAVAAVGSLFALSFDTLSLAAMFALAAARFGGAWEALFVASLFVLGMLVVDGANGAWIHALIRRADRTAAVASRMMALAVAAISMGVGAFVAAKALVPAFDDWSGQAEWAPGGVVVAAVVAAFAMGTWHARRRRGMPALVGASAEPVRT